MWLQSHSSQSIGHVNPLNKQGKHWKYSCDSGTRKARFMIGGRLHTDHETDETFLPSLTYWPPSALTEWLQKCSRYVIFCSLTPLLGAITALGLRTGVQLLLRVTLTGCYGLASKKRAGSTIHLKQLWHKKPHNGRWSVHYLYRWAPINKLLAPPLVTVTRANVQH